MRLRYKLYFILLMLLFSIGSTAQSKPLRIVDTLSATEKNGRDPVLLRSELDSIVREHHAKLLSQQQEEPVKVETRSIGNLVALIIVIALLIFIILMLYRHQQKINGAFGKLAEQRMPADNISSVSAKVARERKAKMTVQSLESKISDMHAELNKLAKENEGLQRVIKEYNGIQHEYDSLKHGIQKAYKVKNYPGYDKTKHESLAMQSVLDTEKAVAAYAYQKFLKPILAITDANKNSPAKLNAADQERLIDLLVSLSLLYIEYLYLRVNDLSIGGRMVERIQGFSKGNGLDASLLKKLNTEFGSRALVVKIALDKTGVHGLSYPVFDETNLNN